MIYVYYIYTVYIYITYILHIYVYIVVSLCQKPPSAGTSSARLRAAATRPVAAHRPFSWNCWGFRTGRNGGGVGDFASDVNVG